jgi:protein gp37
MNPQGSAAKPRGGIEWSHLLGPRTGFTANPVRGCAHRCEWQMPDGEIARCYAKEIRDRLDGDGAFEKITYHPEVLADIKRHKTPAGIFCDSMSDMFGQGVKHEWIQDIIQTIAECPQHVFFSLTKNASRFREFKTPWPSNWLVGISYPPTFMFGKKLTNDQQNAWFKKALDFLKDSPAQRYWVSAEPLSLDLSGWLQASEWLDWVVIGAASNGAVTHQPNPETFRRTLHALEGTPVYFKGNIDRQLADEVAGGWREEFPKMATATTAELQPEML